MRDFIPSKYLVRFVKTAILPLCTFSITRSLGSIKSSDAIDSASDKLFSNLSKLYDFKAEKQISFDLFFRKLRLSNFISRIIASPYNNYNCVRKSTCLIFSGGIENLRPLQSKPFSSSVKIFEEKLKILLLGSCENVVGLTS